MIRLTLFRIVRKTQILFSSTFQLDIRVETMPTFFSAILPSIPIYNADRSEKRAAMCIDAFYEMIFPN